MSRGAILRNSRRGGAFFAGGDAIGLNQAGERSQARAGQARAETLWILGAVGRAPDNNRANCGCALETGRNPTEIHLLAQIFLRQILLSHSAICCCCTAVSLLFFARLHPARQRAAIQRATWRHNAIRAKCLHTMRPRRSRSVLTLRAQNIKAPGHAK